MKNLYLAALVALALGACTKKNEEADELLLGEAEKHEKAEEAKPAARQAPVLPQVVFSEDAATIAHGKDLFAAKGCVGCHKIGGGKLVGPDLKGVTARRDKEWLTKMILHPDVMVKEDETAKKLMAEHLVPMPNQNIDPQKELPPLMSYLKSNEQ